jgi:hypothetical protein
LQRSSNAGGATPRADGPRRGGAIYATRLHLLPREQIESEMARLQVIVDKTAGPEEREAMALLSDHLRKAWL